MEEVKGKGPTITVNLYLRSHTSIWWIKRLNSCLSNVCNSSLQRVPCLVQNMYWMLKHTKTCAKNIQKMLRQWMWIKFHRLEIWHAYNVQVILNNIFLQAILEEDPQGETLTLIPQTIAVCVPCSNEKTLMRE